MLIEQRSPAVLEVPERLNTRAATALASESSAMAPSKLIMGVQDGVLTLSLNRPEKLNAIDNDLSRDLLSALATASRRTRALKNTTQRPGPRTSHAELTTSQLTRGR